MQTSASANWLSVGRSIQQLEFMYNQALQICIGFEKYLLGTGITEADKPFPANYQQKSIPQESINNIPAGYRSQTFSETMDDIRIFLKYISGAKLTDYELNIYKNTSFVFIFSNTNINFNLLESFIQFYIEHLASIISKCGSLQLGVQTVQQNFLQRRYAPGGNIATQAEKDYINNLNLLS